MEQQIIQNYLVAFNELTDKNDQYTKYLPKSKKEEYKKLKNTIINKYQTDLKKLHPDVLVSEISRDYELLSPYWSSR